MKRLEQYDVFSLPVSEVFYDADFNCRGAFTLASVEELAESIDELGLQFPVVVQPAEEIESFEHEDYRWRLIAGHRRFRAVTTFLKWGEIPATVWNGLTDRQARMFNFTENLERKDLNVLEEARALGRLFPEGTSLREAARELKRHTRWVQARFRLLKLPEEVQIKVAAGTLSLVDMEAVAQFETPDEQIKAANDIAKAKRRGRHPSEGKAGRKFRYRKTKTQINRMIAQLLDRGIDGLTTRALAWAAGSISDDDFQADISEHFPAQTERFPVVISDAESG
jgi:ParB family chromosome partitioning protein